MNVLFVSFQPSVIERDSEDTSACVNKLVSLSSVQPCSYKSHHPNSLLMSGLFYQTFLWSNEHKFKALMTNGEWEAKRWWLHGKFLYLWILNHTSSGGNVLIWLALPFTLNRISQTGHGKSGTTVSQSFPLFLSSILLSSIVFSYISFSPFF